ncbi:hypothetical protein [Flavobacterium sp.]|uniref:hypothetical protein n=1 Tax=Flavobacterium sp. TaxID=239 RepID=UPI00260FB2DA|nr:hypothetical protein [Flavobacterium sp.]
MENFDTGYIPSFSWRIINGQSVYEDFIYKGPPVTLYFNAIFMYVLPETGQFFWIRITNYLLFASQVYLIVSAVDNLYDFSKFKVSKWGLMIVGFVVSLLNFSPYPWPTTDGLLFAAMAFWLVSKTDEPKFFRLFAVAFLAVLCALTKQSFYLVPLLFLFWIFMKFNLKTAFVFTIQLLFFVALYLGFILSMTSFDKFIQQTTGETHVMDLFHAGIQNYIFMPVIWFLGLVLSFGLAVLIYLKVKKQKPTAIVPLFKWMAYIIFSIAVALCFVKQIELASRLAFVAAFFALIYSYGFKNKNIPLIAPIIVLLGIAWSCSISLGYQFPIFFATGIVSCFLVLVGKDLKSFSKYYFWIAFPVCLTAFSYNYRPYREASIPNLNYSLETVSPKLQYIKTSKSNFEKYTELKQLIAKYGENFIVAPNIPMANYIFNQQSELPADWLIETEVARSQKMFISLAADKKNYIFLEKSFLNREEFMPAEREKFSSITEFIYENFNCIAQTKHFLVYNALKNNETLP